MSTFDKMLSDIEAHIPKSGFNLVGYDESEPEGEQLYLIGNFETREEAEAERKQKGGYIYPAKQQR